MEKGLDKAHITATSPEDQVHVETEQSMEFFLSSLCLNWTFSKTASNTVLTNWFYMALCQQNPT
jgi:hypothetical protein